MKRAFIVIIVAVLCVSCVCLGYLVSNEGFSGIDPLSNGEVYRILKENKTPREELSLFTVDKDQIVLYYDYEGLINAYSLDGVFQYGIRIESLKNGTGDIAFHDGLLYAKARGGRMYIFEDDTLVSCFRSTDDSAAYQEAERYLEGIPTNKSGNAAFHVIGNKIMKSDNNGPYQTVITLPEQNPEIRYSAIFILLAIAGLMHYLRGRKIA